MKHNNNTARKEYYDVLNRIWKSNRELSELKYFLDTAYEHSDNKDRSPKVVILGTNVPEELIIAAGAKPYWITGGSLTAISWSDDLVPRDTDPLSRSILGFINEPNGVDFSQSLFIIPLTCDSMRKIAYQLKAEGRKICIVDIPPDKKDKHSSEMFKRQLLEMTRAVSKHTGTHITRRSVLNAVKQVSDARRSLHSFNNIYPNNKKIITDSAKALVRSSYYMTDSLSDWSVHLERLINEIELQNDKYTAEYDNRPKIVLAGSPIVFPNYKIPFLIEDIGLSISDAVDPSELKAQIFYNRKAFRGGLEKLICNIADVYYSFNASCAFVKNDVFYEYIVNTIRQSGRKSF